MNEPADAEDIAKLDDIPGWIGHNFPPPDDPVDIASADVAALIANVGVWDKAKPVIENEDDAAACNDFLDQLDKKHKYYDALRQAEKKPHDAASAAVQAKWQPPLSKLLLCTAAIKPRHDAWLKGLKQRFIDERHAREREAAEKQRRADQLAEQAKAGGPGALPNMIEATEAAGEAELARKAVAAIPQRAQTRGALGGRTRSLQTSWHAQVVDWDLWYAQVRERGEVRDVLSRLASAAVRSKDGPRPAAGATEGIHQDMPGCWLFQEES